MQFQTNRIARPSRTYLSTPQGRTGSKLRGSEATHERSARCSGQGSKKKPWRPNKARELRALFDTPAFDRWKTAG